MEGSGTFQISLGRRLEGSTGGGRGGKIPACNMLTTRGGCPRVRDNCERLAGKRETSEDGAPVHVMVYQPMLELLSYLRTNDFKTYIVSGGGVEFMRAWTEKVYGIPPEQVVGSTIKTKFEIRD